MRRNPLEAIARARDEAMAERAKQAREMAPGNPNPRPKCTCRLPGEHSTGCPAANRIEP